MNQVQTYGKKYEPSTYFVKKVWTRYIQVYVRLSQYNTIAWYIPVCTGMNSVHTTVHDSRWLCPLYCVHCYCVHCYCVQCIVFIVHCYCRLQILCSLLQYFESGDSQMDEWLGKNGVLSRSERTGPPVGGRPLSTARSLLAPLLPGRLGPAQTATYSSHTNPAARLGVCAT